MHSQIQRILARWDLKLTHERYDGWSPSLDLVGMVIGNVSQTSSPLQVLQIGANDGVANDPVHDLITSEGTEAVLLEPQPAPFAKLEALHRNRPAVTCARVALADTDGYITMYVPHFEKEAPSRYSRIASFSKRTIAKHRAAIRRAGGTIRALDVPTISAQTLVARYNLHTCDVVAIDTEGFDAEAVQLLLSAGLRPKLLLYEHVHVRGRDDRACLDRLRKHGYLLARVNRDTIAVHADVPGLSYEPRR